VAAATILSPIVAHYYECTVYVDNELATMYRASGMCLFKLMLLTMPKYLEKVTTSFQTSEASSPENHPGVLL
jgi:hypothetical protein